MPFAHYCLNFKGELLCVEPIVAYGWSRTPAVPDQEYNQPKPFLLCVKEFLIWEGSISALVGRIEQLDHDLHNFWVIAVPRIDNRMIDFVSLAGPCGLVITPEKSQLDLARYSPNDRSAVAAAGEPVYSGHGVLKQRFAS